ncbi:major capsid protein P2 [Pseudoalteromonas maricaloris]|uniref:Capsid protein n=1 Tax=Pseudoalteromonas maricaloris TaxID=184924 RepID=A0A8I2HBB7_9GAMM|nr:major capsid protein P2 [Pseudoalteromonas maricaloris]NLR24384.1 capsid protein [Pseudoalteromonas maricaloris]WOX26905.1 major capsid protein P2 [Pseudoalteromonas maricaloris]WOX31393.1 major capsid protein P2 [Pseudoalteromonas maricaloris]
MLELSPLNNITGVHAGGTASVSLPIGLTYETIFFDLQGVTPAQIKNFRVELNGRMLTEYETLAELVKENDYYEREQLDGYVALHFTRPEVKSALSPDLQVQRFFGLGTVGLELAQIKFDIDGAAANPQIKAWAHKSAGTLPGWLFKRRVFRFNFAQGTNEVADIPRPEGAHIALIEIRKPVQDTENKVGVTEVEFLVNNTKWRDRLPLKLHNHILKQGGRTAQKDTFAVDLMQQGDVFSSLMLAKDGPNAIHDMRLRIDCDEGGASSVVVHYADNYAASSF